MPLKKVLFVATAMLASVFSAQAQNAYLTGVQKDGRLVQEISGPETQINGVARVTFEYNDIYVFTAGGKEYRMHEWATSFGSEMSRIGEFCPRCAPFVSFNFIPSKDGKMAVSAKAERWGEIKVTIILPAVR